MTDNDRIQRVKENIAVVVILLTIVFVSFSFMKDWLF